MPPSWDSYSFQASCLLLLVGLVGDTPFVHQEPGLQSPPPLPPAKNLKDIMQLGGQRPRHPPPDTNHGKHKGRQAVEHMARHHNRDARAISTGRCGKRPAARLHGRPSGIGPDGPKMPTGWKAVPMRTCPSAALMRRCRPGFCIITGAGGTGYMRGPTSPPACPYLGPFQKKPDSHLPPKTAPQEPTASPSRHRSASVSLQGTQRSIQRATRGVTDGNAT